MRPRLCVLRGNRAEGRGQRDRLAGHAGPEIRGEHERGRHALGDEPRVARRCCPRSKTAIRGGSGAFFDTRQDGVINNAFSNVQPFVTSLALSYTAGSYNGQITGDFSHPYTGSALATVAKFSPL